jgi:lysylphosphatidylglycerol synthetase-like protein (DUF2156 family)
MFRAYFPITKVVNGCCIISVSSNQSKKHEQKHIVQNLNTCKVCDESSRGRNFSQDIINASQIAKQSVIPLADLFRFKSGNELAHYLVTAATTLAAAVVAAVATLAAAVVAAAAVEVVAAAAAVVASVAAVVAASATVVAAVVAAATVAVVAAVVSSTTVLTVSTTGVESATSGGGVMPAKGFFGKSAGAGL